jgi:NAD(P)-dependent dehydrogenase (short-subunit alcohol dehydrogenase family)
VDVLINNAGVSWFGSMFEDNAVNLFDRVMAINVRYMRARPSCYRWRHVA